MRGNDTRESLGLLEGLPPPEKERAVEPEKKVAPPAPVAKQAITLLPADTTRADITAGSSSSLSAVMTSHLPEDKRIKLKAEIKYPAEGAMWKVWFIGGTKREEWSHTTMTKEITVKPEVPFPLTFEVEAPEGVRYEDRAEIHLTASTSDAGEIPASLTLSWATKQALLAIKTSRGYEREVADTIFAKAEDRPGVIFSLLVPSAIRGYVFAEGMSIEGVTEMLKGIRKSRGLVKGKTTLKEVEPLLAPKVTVEGFVEGAIVEIVSGPFKGEKARVKKIDQEKEQITVELIEAVVPIPVTVRGDHVRMVEKSGS